MTSHRDMALKQTGMIPWYVYGAGGVIYAALAEWLFAESSPMVWVCLLIARWGFSMTGMVPSLQPRRP